MNQSVSISRDGNMWCVLYGENLQEGVSGFGKTLAEAILDFDNTFEKGHISHPYQPDDEVN